MWIIKRTDGAVTWLTWRLATKARAESIMDQLESARIPFTLEYRPDESANPVADAREKNQEKSPE